jgi:hypothetical protein
MACSVGDRQAASLAAAQETKAFEARRIYNCFKVVKAGVEREIVNLAIR